MNQIDFITSLHTWLLSKLRIIKTIVIKISVGGGNGWKYDTTKKDNVFKIPLNASVTVSTTIQTWWNKTKLNNYIIFQAKVLILQTIQWFGVTHERAEK